jgi:hypothetical protein
VAHMNWVVGFAVLGSADACQKKCEIPCAFYVCMC